MVGIHNKEELTNYLVEARRHSYEELYDKIELMKSLYGKSFTDKLWEYYRINIEYLGSNECVALVDAKIGSKALNNLNENKN